jgi:hypothetical protein
MTRALRFWQTLIVGYGMLVAGGGVARCDDPAAASRESIIQGVRDDVRLKIRQREAWEARAELRRQVISARHRKPIVKQITD